METTPFVHSAICFVNLYLVWFDEIGLLMEKYDGGGLEAEELVTRLSDEHSVLIVPGDHFGMDGYLRLGFGERPDYLTRGLERLDALLRSLTSAHARA